MPVFCSTTCWTSSRTSSAGCRCILSACGRTWRRATACPYRQGNQQTGGVQDRAEQRHARLGRAHALPGLPVRRSSRRVCLVARRTSEPLRLQLLSQARRRKLRKVGPMTATLSVSTLDLPLLARGKVRDIYDLGDKLLIVATDRISAFDVVFPTAIPDKGAVLTQLSAFWFEKTGDIVPNHFIRVVDSTRIDGL